MNILFITSTRIGDAVLSMAALNALLAQHPNAAVTIACGPLAAPLFEGVPGLQRIISLKKRSFARHWFKLWCHCIGTRWDYVVDLRGSAVSYFLFAKNRIIWQKSPVLEHRVIALSRLVGASVPVLPTLHTRPGDEIGAAAFLQGLPRPILAVAPIAYWPGKTWPMARFVAALHVLTAEGGPFSKGSILLCGGPAERRALLAMSEKITQVPVRVAAGELDLLTLACVLKKCAFFLGNDSGVMHIAAAAGAPTLGLFGPSRDVVYGPWGARGHVLRTPEAYSELIQRPGFSWTSKETYMDTLQLQAVVDKVRDICTTEGMGCAFSK